MTFGYKQQIWDGENCYMCSHECHDECSKYDDHYFCSEKCLGEYLVEKLDDQIEWIDFITRQAFNDREREIYDDQMNDGGVWND